MPGAGKSTVADFLKDKGFYVVTMGDVIRKKAIEENLPLDDKSLGKLMKDFRKNYGNDIIAKLTVMRIKELTDRCLVVVDGVRSYDEYKVLENIGFVKLLAIHASSNIRYEHIINRERSDIPENHEIFLQRDEREMGIGISKAIALADESISNNNLTKGDLKSQVESIIRKWLHEYNSLTQNNSP